MMKRAIVAMACTLVVLAATPAFSACLKAEREETAEGWLRSERFKDAAGRREDAYILHVSDAVCLEGSGEFDKVAHARTIHVYSVKPDILKRIRKLVGKAVRVRGTPFGAHTAHHHAPIVMDVREIGPR